MGLDQYLFAKRTYYKPYNGRPADDHQAILDVCGISGFVADSEMTTVMAQVGYWRKANAIHGWIVNNCADGVDECQTIRISREQLEQLRFHCKAIMDMGEIPEPVVHTISELTDPSFVPPEPVFMNEAQIAYAEKNLPVTEGFFFGAYEYDSWYFEELRHTAKIIEKILELGSEWSFVYEASW